jgi:hypothetical protein
VVLLLELEDGLVLVPQPAATSASAATAASVPSPVRPPRRATFDQFCLI